MLKNLTTRMRTYVAVSLVGMYQGVAIIPGLEQSPMFGELFGTNTNLTVFLNRFFNIAISLGAVLAVMRIAWAGYLYIGSDLWTNKERGREILQDVALGLLLLLAIFIILKQINPEILNFENILTSMRAEKVQ